MKTSDQDTNFAASTVDEQIDALTELEDEEGTSTSLNARMLQDLYQAYDHASYSRQLERSLERIGQRLEVERVQSAGTNGLKEQQMPQLRAIHAPAPTQSRLQKKRLPARRSLLLSRLASLAAVFFVALLVGSLLLTLLASRHHRSETVGKSEPEIISVHMGPDSFLVSSIILHPGMSLQLVNDNAVVHIIENGYWNDNGQINLLHEPGMPTSPIEFDTLHQTHLIGPFKTAGIYHLLDSIHVFMNLTIRVQSSGTSGVVTPTPVENAARVHLEPLSFLPRTITIHKGMSLLLINDNPGIEHLITNGYWRNGHAIYLFARGKSIPPQVLNNLQHNPLAQIQYIDGQGVPFVNITMLPSNSQVVIGPFSKVGTYSFFDPVHFGMNLTVVVE